MELENDNNVLENVLENVLQNFEKDVGKGVGIDVGKRNLLMGNVYNNRLR